MKCDGEILRLSMRAALFSAIVCPCIFVPAISANATGASSGLDTPTGITSLPFSIQGSEIMDLTQNGLGIGTTNPSVSLDVLGEVRATEPASVACTNNNNGAVRYEANIDYMVYCSANNGTPLWKIMGGVSPGSQAFAGNPGRFNGYSLYTGPTVSTTFKVPLFNSLMIEVWGGGGGGGGHAVNGGGHVYGANGAPGSTSSVANAGDGVNLQGGGGENGGGFSWCNGPGGGASGGAQMVSGGSPTSFADANNNGSYGWGGTGTCNAGGGGYARKTFFLGGPVKPGDVLSINVGGGGSMGNDDQGNLLGNAGEGGFVFVSWD